MKRIPIIPSSEAVIIYGNGISILRDYLVPATVNQVYDAVAGKRKDIIYIKSSVGERPYRVIKGKE